jgi:hypothetical protein
MHLHHNNLKADEHVCLTKNGAKWLLNYNKNDGDIYLNKNELKRLQILAGENHVMAVDTIAIQ